MLSIDEVIAHEREVAAIHRNNDKLNKTLGVISPYYKTDCIKCAEEHEQLANWLEELKVLKDNSISKEAFEKMKSKSHRHGYRQGYSKAIDDFAEEARDMAADIHYKLMDLAVQLKEQSK